MLTDRSNNQLLRHSKSSLFSRIRCSRILTKNRFRHFLEFVFPSRIFGNRDISILARCHAGAMKHKLVVSKWYRKKLRSESRVADSKRERAERTLADPREFIPDSVPSWRESYNFEIDGYPRGINPPRILVFIPRGSRNKRVPMFPVMFDKSGHRPLTSLFFEPLSLSLSLPRSTT